MANISIVEGEWLGGKYMFRRVERKDWDAVLNHIKLYFLHDEPTSKLAGYSDLYGTEFCEAVKGMFQDNLCFLVEERETGEIAAVRITYRHTQLSNFDDVPLESPQMKLLLRLCEITDRMAGLFETYGLEEYAEFFVASCAPNHRRQGLISEMYERNLKFLKAEGFKLAKSLFTSPYTRAAVTKLGFKEVCRLDYRDLYDNNGKLAFNQNDLTEDNFAAVMVKQL